MTLRSIPGAILPAAAALALAASSLSAQQQSCPATTPGTVMPLVYAGTPTVPAITPCDLMTRLYIYAADSMRGREAGTPDAIRATAYLAREAQRLGLRPAGDNGTYFQYMPVTARMLTGSSSLTTGAHTFRPDVDFTVAAPAGDRIVSAPVVFDGALGDTVNALGADLVRGKVVVVIAPATGAGFFGRGGIPASNPLSQAAAIVMVRPTVSRPRLQYILNDTVQNEGRAALAAGAPSRGPATMPLMVTVTPDVAAAMLGTPVSRAERGAVGGTTTIDLKVATVTEPTRSVVAVLPGVDSRLKGEYVVIGAHSDHIGVSSVTPVVEHDSLKAYNMIARVEGADTRIPVTPTPEQWARINALKDSLRRVYPARLDSISNGADDDGSGSVSVLEIAEAFARGPVKPKRSLLFIWQTGEEKGLWGSQWFTNHPTVPRDSIVADLNLDMVGRGAASDVTGKNKEGQELVGSDTYLQLVGSRRLSTELGDMAEQVNAHEPMPFHFDYSMDANGHPQNIYCRSDHANYARYGIPVIFFTTGGHADYHQVTDEPEYIQYGHMARVDQLVFDIATHVANLDHRVSVDKARPDSPFGRCQQ